MQDPEGAMDGDNGGNENSPPQDLAAKSTRQIRSIADYTVGDPGGVTFEDHFSLRVPSSTVKFRGARVHVYSTGDGQFLLEDRGNGGGDNGRSSMAHGHTITVKRMNVANFGLLFLRLCYTLVALFLVGFLFVFCFQVLIFLFPALIVDVGVTSQNSIFNVANVIATLLSIPIFLVGIATLMSIGTTFVQDAWNGGILIRSAIGLSKLVIELFYTTSFLIVPIFTFCVALLVKSNSPWKVAARAWAISVLVVFIIFSVAVTYRELKACFEMVLIYYGSDIDGEGSTWKRWLLLARRAALLSQAAHLSGTRQENYLVSGGEEPPEGGYSQSPDYRPTRVSMDFLGHLTSMSQGCCPEQWRIYDVLDPPVRLYTTEDVRDILPFLTKHNWSLEAVCCQKRKSALISAAKGPSALSQRQMQMSVVCSFVGGAILMLYVVGILVWIDTGLMFYISASVICILCCLLPMVTAAWRAYKMHSDMNQDLQKEEEEGHRADQNRNDEHKTNSSNKEEKDRETMYQVFEKVRITRPRPWYCYTRMALDMTFLFFWPLIVLFRTKNYPVGAIFLILGIFTGLLRYFDASSVLSELGSLSGIDVEDEDVMVAEDNTASNSKLHAHKLLAKSRLSEIVGSILRNDAVGRWMWFFGVLILLVFFLVLSAASSPDTKPGNRPPIVLVDDFYYPPQEETLAYPTCELTKGFKLPLIGNSALVDFAFFSAMAYETPNITEKVLGVWLGEPGSVVDEDVFVSTWRNESGTSDNAVYFKLFTFPALPDFALLSLRGSETSWDWLVNIQLWSSAGLAQMVKHLLPFGWIWTPILPDLVRVVNYAQSKSLKDIAYYKVTTQFVRDLQGGYGGTNYHLYITGASLGGGLSIITGAQTGAHAVAISGLGAELSRYTFDPPVTLEQLDNRVFNFIPDRDYIARIGGRSRLFQEAQCNAPNSNLFGCHSMWRSICEIAFRCGTGERPVVCRCVKKYDYPEPKPINGTTSTTRSFDEACAEEEAKLNN